MLFRDKKSPEIYLAETTQYINDLQRVTLLRDKCEDPGERAHYDVMIHCMQEVMLFMNTIGKRDRARLPNISQE